MSRRVAPDLTPLFLAGDVGIRRAVILIRSLLPGVPLSPLEHCDLQRYAMKMVKEPDARDKLALQAWQERSRLGDRESMP